MKNKSQIAKTAKALAAMRGKLKILRDQEAKMVDEIKEAMQGLGISTIETDSVLVVVEPASRTTLDKEKLIEVIGEKQIKKYEKTVVYSTLRVKEIA